MQHVDALSRVFNILVIESNPFEWNLSVSQTQDPKIIEIRKLLEERQLNSSEMRNGVIYRKKGDNLLFYVPSNMEKHVLFRYHDQMGHLGYTKTKEIISRTYWFPNLSKKIEDHVKNCLKCIFFSPTTGKTEGHVHIVPKGCVPFATIHFDHFGPVDKMNVQVSKKYVFLIVDAFTKFVKLYATKTTSSREAIECLKFYFQNYSRPNTLVSDRGTAFTSVKFSDFLSENHIRHILIATGSPQANGQVERINRTMTPMLAKLTDNKSGLQWYKILKIVENSMNNTVTRSTKLTPSRLLFGVDQRGEPINDVKEFIENQIQENPRNLDLLRQTAQDNTEQAQNNNKEYCDRRRKKAHEYSEGDLVLIRNFDCTLGASKKLTPEFKGPYQVVRRLRFNRYVIADVEGYQNTQKPYKGIWEMKNMRPWINAGDSK